MSYVPDVTGRYTITIKYGGDEIPYSPYRIQAVPSGDASKCLVTGQAPPTSLLLTYLKVSASLTLVFLQCQSEDMDLVSVFKHGIC